MHICVVKSTRPIVDQIYVENYPEMYIISYTSSGVVGNFLLWERKHGIMVTYPIVIGGGGGGVPE